jgi:hypothetical protein
MALRKTIETEGKSLLQTEFGVVDNGTQKIVFIAYIKVNDIYGDKNQFTANVNFKGDRDNGSFNKQYQIPASVESNSKNFIAQAYEHLKTLPEFSGATDC